MTNLKQVLKQPLSNIPQKGTLVLLITALFGFVDAVYLTLKHFKGEIPPCSFVSGCETVLTSEYSVIAGIPVSLGGTIFYLLVLIGLFAYLDMKNPMILKWTLILTIVGFPATLYFLYLQFIVLQAMCVYCIASAITSIILFIGAVWVFSKYRATDTLTG